MIYKELSLPASLGLNANARWRLLNFLAWRFDCACRFDGRSWGWSTELNEQEWLDCSDPDAMAVFLHYHYKREDADRKLSQLACDCLRRIWHLLVDEGSRSAIEFLERRLDGNTQGSSEHWTESEFNQARGAALEGWKKVAELAADGNYSTPLLRAIPDAGLAAYQAVDGDLQCLGNASSAAASYAAPPETVEWRAAKEAEQKAQVAIIRRIFSNPFQAQSVDHK